MRLFLLLAFLVASPALAQTVDWSGGTGALKCDQDGTATISMGTWSITIPVTANVATARFTVPAVTSPPALRTPVAKCKNAFGLEGVTSLQAATFPTPPAPSAPTLLP
jgi:hypothetical protein